MGNPSLSPPPLPPNEPQARQKPSGPKRIKISRACDECRKRKVCRDKSFSDAIKYAHIIQPLPEPFNNFVPCAFLGQM